MHNTQLLRAFRLVSLALFLTLSCTMHVKPSPLHDAIRSNKKITAAQVQQYAHSLTEQDVDFDRTPLCEAINQLRMARQKEEKEQDIARDNIILLLNHMTTAQLNLPGAEQSNALHCAVGNNLSEIVEMLLNRRVNVNALGFFKSTPLHTAMYSQREYALNIPTMLLDAGANPCAPDQTGYTPLHCAAHSGRAELVDLLLQRGAQDIVNTPEHSGRTPLHVASSRENPEVIDLLISAGADPNIQDKQGRTPLDCVAQDALNQPSQPRQTLQMPEEFLATLPKQNTHEDVARQLIRNGADISFVQDQHKERCEDIYAKTSGDNQ